MEKPSFFLTGDKRVGTHADKMCSKLALNGLKTEEGLLVNCWGKVFTCPEESVTNLGSEQTLGRKRQCAQDKGLASRFL